LCGREHRSESAVVVAPAPPGGGEWLDRLPRLVAEGAEGWHSGSESRLAAVRRHSLSRSTCPTARRPCSSSTSRAGTSRARVSSTISAEATLQQTVAR
jgi:hypothetical protein